MTTHDVAEFQRDLNNSTKDIYDFTKIARLNGMETKNILQSEPMNSNKVLLAHGSESGILLTGNRFVT